MRSANTFNPSVELVELARVMAQRFEAVTADEEGDHTGVGAVEIAFHEVAHVIQIKDRLVRDEVLGGNIVGAFAVGDVIEQHGVADHHHEMTASAVAIEMASMYLSGEALDTFTRIAEHSTTGNLPGSQRSPAEVFAIIRGMREMKVNKDRARRGAKYIDRFIRMYRNQ